METQSPDIPGRRRFLGGVIATIQTILGGSLGVILGGAVVSPGLARRQEDWLPAGTLADLPVNEPTPVTIRVTRRDGYAQIVDRRVVFLVKTGNADVTALDATCTHLGCRVSWNPDAKELRCPCHGGVFDSTGAVKGGPPPHPLVSMPTRIDGERVLVRV